MTLLLAIDAQLLDLATAMLAIRTFGIGGEISPLHAGGMSGIVVGKCLGILAFLGGYLILRWRERPDWRVRPRHVALLVALAGIIGAATNVAAWA